MTLFQLVIGPMILIGIFFLGLWLLAARYVRSLIRTRHAQEKSAMLPQILVDQQSRAIIDTINELELNKVSYMGIFPDELKAELLAAHRSWAAVYLDTSYERKGIH